MLILKGEKICMKKLFLCIFFIVLCGCVKDSEYMIKHIDDKSEDIASNVTVHFLNTGNSDCIFVQGDKNLLIDAGENDDEEFIVDYLQDLNVSKLDYVLSTHPHADHIGGMDAVVRNFDIDDFLICKGENFTKEYREMMYELEMKDVNSFTPEEDFTISLGNGVDVKFMNCELPDTEDKNDWSIVAELICEERKVLLMADAQILTEQTLLPKLGDIDVLKAGHHGDISSSSQSFIDKVLPEYVVVTTGENPYGHPSIEVLQRFQNKGAEVLRTNEKGTIVMNIKGNNISFENIQDINH